MKSTLILLLVSITFFTVSLTAQHSYISSERTYTTKDGLSSDKVYTLHKDRQGFIWIGTENGLDRFDGQAFKHFNPSNQPQMTISRVQNILEDEDNYFWLLEANETFEHAFLSPEINLFNSYTGHWTTLEERFGEALPFKVDNIRYIQQLTDGRIFIFTQHNHKGYFYSKEHGFTTIPIPKEIVIISEVLIQQEGPLLIEGGVSVNYMFDWNIYKIQRNGKIIAERKADLTISIQEHQQTKHIALKPAYHVSGGFHLDAYDRFDKDLKLSHQYNSFIQIDQASWNKDQQLLWLKNAQSIKAINTNNEVVFSKEDDLSFSSLPFLFDGETTWYGHDQGGLIKITLEPNHFQTFQYYKKGLDNSSRGIYASTDGHLWASMIAGVVKKDNHKVSEKHNAGIPFTAFMKDKSNHLWFFYDNKIMRENLSTHERTGFDANGMLTSWSLFEAKQGEIWTFGQHGEIYALNIDEVTLEFKSQFNKDRELEIDVYWAQRKDAGTIWLCTSQGLYVVDNDGAFVAVYNNEQEGEYFIPAKDIHHMYQPAYQSGRDNDGLIWLATGDGGLVRLTADGRRQTGTSVNRPPSTIYRQYTVEDGLSCNALHAIYEDDNDYLWISSNNGLMQLDKRTNKVTSYFVENGLLHNEFNRISHFQAEDGRLYFGGLNGVISFHPNDFKQVRKQTNTAQLVVKDFQQFSTKEKQFKDLTYQLSQSKTITLRPHERFFKMQLALLNYKEGTTFQYRIEGVHDWQTTANEELSISGLPYGKHTLEIKATNHKQQEAANTLTYTIHVLRPFYLQWWFVALVLSALGFGVFLFFKWRTQQMLIAQEAFQLRQLDTMKSQFFANISHELRTPITLILAPLAQLLSNHRKQSSEEIDRQLINIQYNGKHLLNLVNEVLDLSKLEAQKLELNLTPTHIPKFIERVVANFESAAQVKGIEFQFMSFLQEGIIAQFDQPKLEKILNNLLSNALKFTSKNGSIQILVTQANEDLVIKVKDSGKGILQEDLPHIFDRYFQSTDKSMSGGTGIGLALTKELVELMNGQISAQSEFGKGTEFEVRLPIELVSNPDVLMQIENKNPTLRKFETFVKLNPTTTSTEKDTILLVEDNPSLQQFIQSVLAPHYNVIVTGNGVEALERLTVDGGRWTENNKANRLSSSEATVYRLPSLILSDVMMPEMDGFTLLEKVKADDRFCSIPFILLTARADINDKLRGLRIGVDDYMTKPFEVEELLLRIKKLISNSKNRVIENKINPTTKKQSKQKSAKQLETSPTKVRQATSDKQPATSHQQPVTSHDLDWLKQVEDIAKREIRNKQFKLDDLAAEIFISKRQLIRKIKSITGLTPTRYIRTIRLQMAKNILEKGECHTITAVSFETGFENPTYFAQLFKEEFGKHPQEYLTDINA